MHLVLVRPLWSTRMKVQLLRLRALPSTISLRRRPTLRLMKVVRPQSYCNLLWVVRGRENFTKDEMLMLTNMSDIVNNIANALRETGLAHVDPDLFLAVMEMPGFSKEALICAYTFLLDNKA